MLPVLVFRRCSKIPAVKFKVKLLNCIIFRNVYRLALKYMAISSNDTCRQNNRIACGNFKVFYMTRTFYWISFLHFLYKDIILKRSLNQLVHCIVIINCYGTRFLVSAILYASLGEWFVIIVYSYVYMFPAEALRDNNTNQTSSEMINFIPVSRKNAAAKCVTQQATLGPLLLAPVATLPLGSYATYSVCCARYSTRTGYSYWRQCNW